MCTERNSRRLLCLQSDLLSTTASTPLCTHGNAWTGLKYQGLANLQELVSLLTDAVLDCLVLLTHLRLRLQRPYLRWGRLLQTALQQSQTKTRKRQIKLRLLIKRIQVLDRTQNGSQLRSVPRPLIKRAHTYNKGRVVPFK